MFCLLSLTSFPLSLLFPSPALTSKNLRTLPSQIHSAIGYSLPFSALAWFVSVFIAPFVDAPHPPGFTEIFSHDDCFYLLMLLVLLFLLVLMAEYTHFPMKNRAVTSRGCQGKFEQVLWRLGQHLQDCLPLNTHNQSSVVIKKLG